MIVLCMVTVQGCVLSVDSRNFKKWGRSPTTTQNVGEGLKILGDDFMIKFKLIKNTFSVYLDIFNSGLLLINGQFLLSCPIKINFKATDRILKKILKMVIYIKVAPCLSRYRGFKFSSKVTASQIQSLHHQFAQICWKTPQNTMTS